MSSSQRGSDGRRELAAGAVQTRGARTQTSVFAALQLERARGQLAQGETAAAKRTLRALTDADPSQGAALNLLSILANTEGDFAAAFEYASRSLAVEERAEYAFSLGRALKNLGRLDEAIGAYRRALRWQERYPEAWVSLGIAQRLQGQIEAAIASYRMALRLRPDFPEALLNLGNALAEERVRAQGDRISAEELREAERVQRRAVEIMPENPNALHNLAMTLKLMARYEEAAGLFNRALGIDPRRIDSCIQWGDLLFKMECLEEMRGICRRWLEVNGENPDVMLQLAIAQVRLGETEEAETLLRRVLDLRPEMAEARHFLGLALQQTVKASFDSREALESYRSAMAARPDYQEAQCAYLMTLSYLEEDPVVLYDEHARIGQNWGPIGAPEHKHAKRGRIRLGYMSYDFKRHSVAFFLEALLEHHDRSRFEIFCYQNNHQADAVTQRLKAHTDQWVTSGQMTDAELASRIQSDGIDILVDLSGLTSGGRMGVLRQRPAPCQITYLGYPTTTGSRALDYRITDSIIDPPGAERFSVEQLLRCEPSMFCYRPDTDAPVARPPFEKNGFITFGSFNNLAKVSQHTLGLWADTLRAVEDSRFLVKGRAVSQRGNLDALRAFFEGRGVDPGRILAEGWRPYLDAHLAAYADVDIALDTFPYNGATTTCEALWMGVPVVSLQGATHVSRMGASILSAAALSDLVATDDAGFIQRAAALACDWQALGALRLGLRERLVSCPLMDGRRYARTFEESLLRALEGIGAA